MPAFFLNENEKMRWRNVNLKCKIYQLESGQKGCAGNLIHTGESWDAAANFSETVV